MRDEKGWVAGVLPLDLLLRYVVIIILQFCHFYQKEKTTYNKDNFR